ncbi:AAA family ATPase [Variovorax terrae]|uniref:AAA family ATPase n=1 Tax=Variovorax terrae TaxID=2923278 RepID=A0A9X1W121_9BURK|nr:AAA family ATPase [Variovorax terrae]MCJ0764168.1 AAA family ATPase [Variovorax terrae]
MLTPTLTEKWAGLGAWSPLAALKRVGETKWLVDGIVPAGSINWMVAAPGSFKTFLALDMASCVAGGRAWHGRETDQAVVVYLAAEGGNDIHVRRAAIDLAAGDTGPLAIVQCRPRLDEAHGLASLLGYVNGAAGGPLGGLPFPEMHGVSGDLGRKYLTPDEIAHVDELEADEVTFDDAYDFIEKVGRPRYNAWDEAITLAYENCAHWGQFATNVFLVVDTYSQTSADDAKGTVSRYIKTLRDLQDKATALGGTVTVLVVDHTTKSGDSYMGSLAKEGDSDTMIEVDRPGDGYSVTVKCAKMKGGIPFAPIHLDMKPVALDGFTDALGRPLTSLVVTDGEQSHKVRAVAGADKDTSAAVVLTVLTSAGPCGKDTLKRHFLAHGANAGKNPATAARNFLRGLQNLKDEGVIAEQADGLIALAEGVDLPASDIGHHPLS